MINGKIHTVRFESLHGHFKGVIERYAFYLTGNRQLVEDTAQEIFFKALDELGTRRRSKQGSVGGLCLCNDQKLRDRSYQVNKTEKEVFQIFHRRQFDISLS